MCAQCPIFGTYAKSADPERGVWSWSTVFAYRNFYLKYEKKKKTTKKKKTVNSSVGFSVSRLFVILYTCSLPLIFM